MTYQKVKSTYISGWPDARGVVYALLFLAAMAGVSMLYWTAENPYSQLVSVNKDQILNGGEYWRLWTATLAHSDKQHLLSNTMMLFVFGYLVGGYFGWIMFPLGAFLLGGLINLIVIANYTAHVSLVGASGIVYLLAGCWLTLYALIDRRYEIKRRLLRAVGVCLVLLFPSTYAPATSYSAHAVGLAIGVLWALAFFGKNRDKIRAAEIIETVTDDDLQ